ncbi:MAG: hypothetical protein H6954_09090 [Chromatiaceae bacterium]|nr:hypothetical protein [Chromatiaceae bacterium]
MARQRSHTGYWIRAFIVLTAVLGGCAQNAPYHTGVGAAGNCRGVPVSDVCSKAYYQEHDGYDLAFAEYSDRGNAFDDSYIADVLKRISNKARGEGVVLVVFVHGWKHNADEADPNLIDFKKALMAVHGILQKDFGASELGKRRLVGLYVGWRGANLTWPGIEQATFWDRKAVAGEVGKGGVTRLLLELDEFTGDRDENVMVVIGHSFGGAIVVSALNDILTERVIHRTRGKGYAPTLGDGVLVLNPAIEANQALTFVEAAIQADYRPEQHPLFVSLSSDADWATHIAFPAGQTVGLLATWRQTDLRRSYYYDREKPNEKKVLREQHLDTTTVGNFAPFLTHRLTASEVEGKTLFHVRTCDAFPEGCKPKGLTTLDGLPAIRKLPKNYPLFFFKTDDTVMTGHNDIFNQRVRSFVVTVIDDVVRRSLAKVHMKEAGVPTAAQMSILADPKALEQRMESILQQMPPDSGA